MNENMSATFIFCFHVLCFCCSKRQTMLRNIDSKPKRPDSLLKLRSAIMKPQKHPETKGSTDSSAQLEISSSFPSPVSDLPPPPEPPPDERRLECVEASGVANGALSSPERSEYGSSSQRRRGSGQRHGDSKSRPHSHQSLRCSIVGIQTLFQRSRSDCTTRCCCCCCSCTAALSALGRLFWKMPSQSVVI